MATATVQVTVVENPTQLPATADALAVGPAQIVLNPTTNTISATVSINNLNSSNTLDWSVTSSEPWLVVDVASGTTPMRVVVSLNQAQLPIGTHTATLRFSTTASEQIIDVPVRVENDEAVEMKQIYLPLIRR